MKFFIPTIDSENAEDFLENSIIRFVESQGYKILRGKKIYSLTFNHNGKTITDTVGQYSESNKEPMLAGKEGTNVTYFDVDSSEV